MKAASRGRLPTSMVATTLSEAVSTTDTVWVDSAVTYTRRPSGLTATPSGSIPTFTFATIFASFTSMTEAMPSSSLDT